MSSSYTTHPVNAFVFEGGSVADALGQAARWAADPRTPELSVSAITIGYPPPDDPDVPGVVVTVFDENVDRSSA